MKILQELKFASIVTIMAIVSIQLFSPHEMIDHGMDKRYVSRVLVTDKKDTSKIEFDSIYYPTRENISRNGTITLRVDEFHAEKDYVVISDGDVSIESDGITHVLILKRAKMNNRGLWAFLAEYGGNYLELVFYADGVVVIDIETKEFLFYKRKAPK